jgi:hypothetical protein
MSKRASNGRSNIYLGADGKYHGWVTMGVKADGSPDRRHRMGKTANEVTKKIQKLESERDSGLVRRPGARPRSKRGCGSGSTPSRHAPQVSTPSTARTGPRSSAGSFRALVSTASTGCEASTSTRSTSTWSGKGCRQRPY